MVKNNLTPTGRILYVLFVLLFIFNFSASKAEIILPRILSSNMVLQRNAEIKIWGWADKGEKIKVNFDQLDRTAKTTRDGKWSVVFPAMKEGGPYKMVIQGKNNTHILLNIMIGDVWVCSGQSNMEWSVARSANPDEEILNADYPMVRLLTIPRNAQLKASYDVPETEWKICTPENISGFSAVGYYFGRMVHTETGVPIGLINTSWGGTNVETWTSVDYISPFPEYAEKLKLLDGSSQQSFKPNDVPSQLFNGMIHPLLYLKVKGAIWYQGESNAGRAYRYRELFPNMINCWRTYWKQPDMPFLFVQLANFRAPAEEPGESDWAELREAQLMTLSLNNTGMAVTIDIGDANDIHPANKQDVGKRLALNALKIAYNKDIVSLGPLYRSMEISGDKAILSFDNTGSGLEIKDKYGYLKGFAIAGNDKKFYWAKANIEGDKVIVNSASVPSPVAVRYGWANNPDDVNLYNKEGLPASPFRTDDWKGITADK